LPTFQALPTPTYPTLPVYVLPQVTPMPTFAPTTAAPSSTRMPTSFPSANNGAFVASVTGFLVLDKTALDDPNSPQARTIDWMSTKDQGSNTQDTMLLTSRFLVALMSVSLGGSILHNPVLDTCDWIGVTCGGADNVTVTAIAWPQLNLTGSLPLELGLLSDLEELDLSDNAITGSLPATFYQMTSLTSLYLNSNGISGSIASEIGNMKQLVNVFLGQNQLVGSIPNEWRSDYGGANAIPLRKLFLFCMFFSFCRGGVKTPTYILASSDR